MGLLLKTVSQVRGAHEMDLARILEPHHHTVIDLGHFEIATLDGREVIDGSGTDAVIGQALGSRRFEVIVRGPGGHSWSDFGQPNPIVAVSRVVSRFSQTALPSSPKTTFNFGVISGGTSVNSIPEIAQVSIDLRSASAEELQRLEDELRGVIHTEIPTRARDGAPAKLSVEIKKIGDRPAGDLPGDCRILEVMRAVDAHLGIASQLRRASTDARRAASG